MKRSIQKPFITLLLAMCMGAIYAFVTWFILRHASSNPLLSTLTCGFLFLTPFALGMLTIHLIPIIYRSRLSALVFPFVPTTIMMGAAAVSGSELIICIIMAAPIFYFMGSVGGLTAHEMTKKQKAPAQPRALGAVLLLPLLIAPIENELGRRDSFRTVHNEIVIAASAADVWQEIASVPAIQAHEHRPNLLHRLGLPRPIAAELSREGVGGIRTASFEGGLFFNEVVTVWQPEERIRFTIEVDTTQTTLQPYDEIGGAYLEIIDGEYWIEPLSEDSVKLHLQSTHRLSTNFSAYGGLWTDFIMYDLQRYIMEVIKVRAENHF